MTRYCHAGAIHAANMSKCTHVESGNTSYDVDGAVEEVEGRGGEGGGENMMIKKKVLCRGYKFFQM